MREQPKAQDVFTSYQECKAKAQKSEQETGKPILQFLSEIVLRAICKTFVDSLHYKNIFERPWKTKLQITEIFDFFIRVA